MRLRFIGLGLCLAVPIASTAMAGPNYPSRPITVIVPLPAGSAADAVARLVLPAAEKYIGQPFVIENQGGAASIPGTERAARADADGYTLLWGTIATHSANPNLYASLPYNAGTFVPIIRVAAQSLIMAVPTSSGITSVDAFVKKAKGASLSFASTGIGNSNHLIAEMLMQEAGIKMRHIPYAGGTQPVLDLMRGEIDTMFYSQSQFQPGLQTRELTLLAATSEQRSKFLPDLPTMKELGFDVVVTSWYGAFAPANTSEENVAKVADAIGKALQEPKVIEALEKTGTEVWATSSPAEFAKFLTAERARYAALVKGIGLKKR